jgi:tRNA G46 methylase TrmB
LRLLVRLVKPSIRKRRIWRDDYVQFECRVLRLIGPIHRASDVPDYIHADVELPDQYHEHALRSGWNSDGTYRVEVRISHNSRTLGPFLSSGDLEWDVRGMP